MKKIPFWIALIVLLLSVLCGYSYLVALAAKGKHMRGLGAPLRSFAMFPKTVSSVLSSQEIRGAGPSMISTDDGYDPATQDVNLLKQDLFGLMPFFDGKTKQWEVVLENFRTGERLRIWELPPSLFEQNTDRVYAASRPKHSLVMPDGGLIVNFTRTRNLLRIDAESRPVWANREMFYHHGMNVGPDGHIWVCATPYAEGRKNPLMNYSYRNPSGDTYAFRDDHATKIDRETGEILETHSIAELLRAHDQFGRLIGQRGHADPIHLNDIEPVLEDGPHWLAGDLFLSCRNLSAVIHFRPATNEIVKIIEGPLIRQHDAVILSDHEVSFFNNYNTWAGTSAPGTEPELVFPSSELTVYDYATDSLRVQFKEVMNQNRLHTPTAGLHYPLTGGRMLLDLDDFGRIVVVDSTDILFSRTYPAPVEGYKHLTSWPRIYQTSPL